MCRRNERRRGHGWDNFFLSSRAAQTARDLTVAQRTTQTPSVSHEDGTAELAPASLCDNGALERSLTVFAARDDTRNFLLSFTAKSRNLVAFMVNEDRKTLEQRAQMTNIERLRHSAAPVLLYCHP